jgi:hypothetical protein
MVRDPLFILRRTKRAFSPNENAQYVLETVAGFAQKHRLEIGTASASWHDFNIVSPDKSSVDS